MPESNNSSLDLRSYLDFVRKKGAGTYREIVPTISPRWETTAVVIGLAQKLRSPVLYFKSVENCRLPMVTNVCSSVERRAATPGPCPRLTSHAGLALSVIRPSANSCLRT